MTVSPTHSYIVDDDQPSGKSLKRLLKARGMPEEYSIDDARPGLPVTGGTL